MKIGGTGAVVVFATKDLAESFAAAMNLRSPYRVVTIEELGSTTNPYPDNWSKTNRAVFFDSELTLDRYLNNKDAFAYDAHITTLQVSIFINQGRDRDAV